MRLTYRQWTRRLRRLRKQSLYRQEDVARQMRISRSHYSAIENAQSTVNYHQLRTLAKIFQLSMAELIELRVDTHAQTTGK